MNSLITQNKIPIYRTNGFFDFEKIARIFGCRIKDLGMIVGVSERTLKKPTLSPKTIKKSQSLIHIMNLLWSLFEGREVDIKKFLNDPRIEWYGISPLTALQQGKTEAVIKMLERIYYSKEGM